ncbi:hypothetical protein A6U87_02285 [Rhizobium sp. AC44/96]|uniref:hypothetical protein n=1 Tax=unclassified Rhizobium TaxID=2613769 RepID=UPI00080FF73F|nr:MULTISPECIES: hypothetical protein [unclassified Rhizobium]MDM9623826.1 hypothetical protein [Rhizobium sp. S96]OCJ17782.1 hypothetical protein A6U87_02285 [Rhizobium sp. AC44/96]
MRRTILALTVLCGATQAAHADSRFFCSADDKDVRFTIESGFEAKEGHRLNHFRGAIMIKSADVSPVFKKVVFNSDHLTQNWSHAGELRLAMFYDGGDETGGQTLDLVIAADQHGKSAAAFSGTYELVIEGAAKPFTASSKISCGSK